MTRLRLTWMMIPLLFLTTLTWAADLQIRESKTEGISLTRRDAIFGVNFAGQLEGWAVGKFGLILHTQDGGKTWKSQESGTKVDLFAGSFVNEKKGWVVGMDGIMLATEDGGTTWRRLNSAIDNILHGVIFLDESLGFVAGEYSTLLKTENGGKNWEKIEVNWQKLVPSLIEKIGLMNFHFYDVAFVDRDHGWICGEYGIILFTKDGGKTWSVQNADPDYPQLYKIFFPNSNEGWIVGQGGALLQSKDGGKSWKRKNLGLGNHLFDISFHGTEGIITGEFLVLHSGDRGMNWQEIKKLSAFPWFSAIGKTGGKRFVLAGKSGKILLIDSQ